MQVTVAQLGSLDAVKARNAIGIANGCQRDFDFGQEILRPDFAIDSFKLANGGFDFDLAAQKCAIDHELREPVVFFTDDPYGDASSANTPEEFYFYGDHQKPDVAIVSTYLWEKDLANRNLQQYLLFMLGTSVLSMLGGLFFHSETVGCIFDFDWGDDPKDLMLRLQSGKLCRPCQNSLTDALKSGRLSFSRFAAAMRIINRGRGVKQCFVVMPFRKQLDGVYARAIRPQLEQQGWSVVRADKIAWPRLITDAILLQILMADLIVADLSGHNPNVFYEIGVADAVGADMIFVAQDGEEIPFDVKDRRTIFYQPQKYKRLKAQLGELAGEGRHGRM